MRSLLAGAVVVLVGGFSLWLGTDGLRAFTAEQARRLAVQQHPRPLPLVTLQDQDGRRFSLADYHGRIILVDFVYTRCRSLCSVLGTSFQQIYRALPSNTAGRDVFLLTISFDPANDTTGALKRYAQYHRADGSTWRIARIDNDEQLRAVLEAFGIVVIPDQFGEFQHNAAIHLVDRAGRLARVFDYDKPESVVSSAPAWL